MGATKTSKGQWRYDFQIAGQRYTKRGYVSRREALKAEQARREEILRELSGDWPTFSEMAKDYLRELKHRASDEWVRNVYWKVEKHASGIMGLPPREVRPLHVQRLVTGVRDKVSPSAANEIRKILHAIFQWAEDLGAIERNPVKSVRRTAVQHKEQQVFTSQDLRAVIVAAEPTLRALLLVQATTGARCREVLSLRPPEVQLEDVPAFVVLHTGKTGGKGKRPRKAYLPPMAANALRVQMQLASEAWVFRGRKLQNRLTYIAAARQLWRACERAKVARYGFHAVRRWAGTVAMESGNSNVVVSRFLGHTKTTVTDLYMKVGDPLMAAVGEVLADEIQGKPENGAGDTGREESHQESHREVG